MSVRVLLADDHLLLMEGLKLMLSHEVDIEVVGVAQTGEEALRETLRLQPDVLVLDIGMPGRSGLEVAREVRANLPDCRLIFLTGHSEPDLVTKALCTGAIGYHLKSAMGQEFALAIRSAAKDVPTFSSTIATLVLKEYVRRSNAVQDVSPQLSDGEMEVMRLVSDGHTTNQIAARLYLSPKTVEKTRQRILRKLGVRDSAGMVREAMRMGLLPG